MSVSASRGDFFAEMKEWAKVNVLWIAAHVINLLFGIAIYIFKILDGESGIPILPIVISMCIVFVHIFTYPIEALPAEGSTQDERKRIEDIRSRQRNKWMIFAYSFMLISLLLTFYPFINPLFSFVEKTSGQSGGTVQQESTEQEKTKPDAGRYLKTLRERPIAVFVGCSLDPKAKTLLCSKSDAEPEGDAQKAQNPGGGTAGKAWVINIGGHIDQCTKDDDPNFGKSVTCQVKDGLLIPLYFIIMALMGGSISLTRRLPELQKQAGSEHIATEQQPKLTQYEFREHLIFQMVQYISAPFLAILAYYLIEPGNITNSVVLAFTAGFASETILLMVRSIANKITPGSGEALQYGAIAGVVTIQDAAAKKAEVFLTELPQIHSITDEQGFYVLSNVPVGEHSISVKSTDNEAILKKDTVKIERAQAIVKKNLTIAVDDGGQK
ncbi:carboxypeptidase-like regulatory domain-containing protein [Nitrosomonas sp. Is35]|uniref:carboxypeptidase-like regulatory domain-containing protein n=1 Tax=Nitrosomonas sp. Is35 TaxID=3080534 RepID=UPI00294B5003|nr:carboxypeptidase-like regulatory domain-containing protein [Nitrosomonas sp. Is35]MDV6348551.1 carboxypeptidase-like regulatory domain-containing protein [Nitrosomonas sp. Is35]